MGIDYLPSVELSFPSHGLKSARRAFKKFRVGKRLDGDHFQGAHNHLTLLSSNLHCTCSEDRGRGPLLRSSIIKTELEDDALKRRMSMAV